MTTPRQLVAQIRKATNQIDFDAPYAGMIAARELDFEHASRLMEFFVGFVIYTVIKNEMSDTSDQVYDFAWALTVNDPTIGKALRQVKEEMGL